MSRTTEASSTRLWRGFRRPVGKDKVFWIAIGLSGLAVAAETALSAAVVDVNPIASAAVAVLVVVVVMSVVGAIAGAVRGFRQGWRDPAPSTPAPGSDQAASSSARRSVPSVGALSEAAKAKAKAANVRPPTAADLDKGARTLGRALGAAKRAARSQPDDD